MYGLVRTTACKLRYRMRATRRLVRWNRRGGGRRERGGRGVFRDGWGLLRRQWRHQRQGVIAGGCEFVPVAFGYWIGGRQRQALEIQEFFAVLDAEIQVRASRETGHADQANPLALLDVLS